MRVPKEIQPVHPKGNSPEYSLEGLMLKLKLQYSGHLMRRTDSLEKTLMLGKVEGWTQVSIIRNSLVGISDRHFEIDCVQFVFVKKLFYIQQHILQLVYHHLSSVQLSCLVQLFVTPWTTAFQASLSITNSQSLLKLMSIESVMPSNHLILCRPFLLPPSIFPSIRVF